jgi:hypothetical protein
LDEVAQGHLGHNHQTSPPQLTLVWKGNPTSSHSCSLQGILTSHGGEEVRGYSRSLRVSGCFPNDLLAMPPERAIEFKIELQSGTTPIVKAPYKMSPVELAELI